LAQNDKKTRNTVPVTADWERKEGAEKKNSAGSPDRLGFLFLAIKTKNFGPRGGPQSLKARFFLPSLFFFLGGFPPEKKKKEGLAGGTRALLFFNGRARVV
jgi:hypothetical protein